MGPEDQCDPLEECYKAYESLKKIANDRAAVIVNLNLELLLIKQTALKVCGWRPVSYTGNYKQEMLNDLDELRKVLGVK